MNMSALKARYRRATQSWRKVRAPLAVRLVVLSIAVLALVFLGPRYVLGSRSAALSPQEQLQAEAEIRSSLLQLLGGSVLVMGLYFTARGFALTREGHITDRYAKAIEHLGSSSIDVRIGGVYSLERLARDSLVDRETILEVLTTFVREHTKLESRTPSEDRAGADVQAAVAVLARRPGAAQERRRLDFYHAGLNDVSFRSGDFRNAMFLYTRLTEASFAGCNLDGADFSFGKGRQTAFSSASAIGCGFVHASYTHSWFIKGNFTDADFYGCDLTASDFGRRYERDGDSRLPPAIVAGARFTRAKLAGTNLRGVDLRTAIGLTREQLSHAITDEYTQLPLVWGRDHEDGDQEDVNDDETPNSALQPTPTRAT